MLEVVTMQEAARLIETTFSPMRTEEEVVALADLPGRVLSRAVHAPENMPPFRRSTVDGYAVRAADTFGCTDAIPAILSAREPVLMGRNPVCACDPSSCVAIPTGGKVPDGANAVVMIEHTEDYADGTIGILKPVAPGENIVFEGDELREGGLVADRGTKVLPHHIGAFASLGIASASVFAPVRVGVISTGDEIVPSCETPDEARMRDVNGPLLEAALRKVGAEPLSYGVVADNYDALFDTVKKAIAECDVVLVSGGSSVGERDNTARVFCEHGTLLFHGIAVKPGKPTLCADAQGTALFGLPGHPLAAYFIFLELVQPLLMHMMGDEHCPRKQHAILSTAIPSNHGRSEYVAVRLDAPMPIGSDGAGVLSKEGIPDDAGSERVASDAPACEAAADGGLPRAYPLRAKSGLIALLANADGYLVVDRDCEGLAAGALVSVIMLR